MLGGRVGLSLEAGLLTSPSWGDTSPYFTSIQLSLWIWPLSRQDVSDKNVPWDVTIV